MTLKILDKGKEVSVFSIDERASCIGTVLGSNETGITVITDAQRTRFYPWPTVLFVEDLI